MCENDVFFLPVNILKVWRAGFLGRTTHYRVSYYYYYLLLFVNWYKEDKVL